MTESTARAALFERQSSTSPMYAWEVPQKPVSVRIPFPVIDRLENEAVESFRSLSSKGSEVGGVLFGSVFPGQSLSVLVEDYELIECDYSRGPLYRLGDVDSGRFDRVIQQHGSSGALAVVGFFRSHTRKGLSLDVDDLTFFDSRFREAHHIALLIRPFATKASSGGIFIREGGKVNGEASYLEFPFRSSLLTPGKPPAEAIEPPPAPTGLGGALPAPSVPRTTARGQIVPIASRREASPPSAPEPVASVSPAVEVAEPVKPAPVNAASAAAPPKVAEPPKPVAKVEEKVVAPKVEERSIKPKAEEKAVAPKVEERAIKPKVEEKVAAPKVEERAIKPKVEEKAAPAKVEEKAIKSKVEEKPAPPKAEEKAKPKVEERSTSSRASSAYSFTAPAAAATPVVEEQPAGLLSGKMLWVGLGGLVTVIVLVVLFVYPAILRHKGPSGPIQDTSQLSLRVERTAGELLLTWNRDSDAIRSATHAVLSIADGDQHENVEMDLAQLRNGSISYAPASGDVVFKMEVTGKGNEKTASESVRALRTKPNPTAGPDQPTQSVQTPGKPGVTPPNGNTSTNPASTTSNPTAAAAEPPAAEEAPKTPEKAPLRAFQAPSLSQRLHPANPSDLPDAPTLGRSDPSTPAVSGMNFNSVSAPVAPRPAAPTPAPTAQTPPNDRKVATGGQIQPAVLMRRKEPEYPKLARETGAKGVVRLIATIGADGKVKAVKIVGGPPMLQKSASDAVMQWVYKPTMLNGVAVEAQTEVLVNFMGTER